MSSGPSARSPVKVYGLEGFASRWVPASLPITAAVWLEVAKTLEQL